MLALLDSIPIDNSFFHTISLEKKNSRKGKERKKKPGWNMWGKSRKRMAGSLSKSKRARRARLDWACYLGEDTRLDCFAWLILSLSLQLSSCSKRMGVNFRHTPPRHHEWLLWFRYGVGLLEGKTNVGRPCSWGGGSRLEVSTRFNYVQHSLAQGGMD